MAPASTGPTLLDHVGGTAGIVQTTIPVVVFVAANTALPLLATIVVSLAVGLGLTVVRLLRGERLRSAVGSLLGVGLAAGVVAWTGSARDFFAVGNWAFLAAFVVLVGSLAARRPLSGVVWNTRHGGGHAWRTDRAVLRAHDLATLAAALAFGSRFAVQHGLYLAADVTAQGVARIAMGPPLTALVALAVVWAFRRSTRQLVASA